MKVKILQINTWLGGKLWDNLIEFIKKENPDIIIAQEVHNGKDKNLEQRFRTIQAFKEIFNYPYHDFAPELRDITEGLNIDHGNAIFSKFPITAHNHEFFFGAYGDWDDADKKEPSAAPRNIEHVVIDAQGTILNVFNLHGIVDYRGEYDSPERLIMSKTVVDQIKGKKNIILAGDTNVQPNTETIRNIEAHVENVFKNELTTSFNMRRKTIQGYATAVVDMIFVSSNIKVLEHYCPDVDVSDHFPLVAVIEI